MPSEPLHVGKGRVQSPEAPATSFEDGMTTMDVPREMGFARTVTDRVIFFDGGGIEDTGTNAFLGTPRSARAQSFLSRILSH